MMQYSKSNIVHTLIEQGYIQNDYIIMIINK